MAGKIWVPFATFAVVLAGTLAISSCKKNALHTNSSPEIILLAFNKGTVSTINKAKREVVVETPEYVDRKNLVAIFQVTDGAVAKVNGVVQQSSTTPNDFTLPVKYTISSKHGQSEWTVKLVSNSYTIGLGSEIGVQNRITKDFDWYVPGGFSVPVIPLGCMASVLRWCHPVDYYGIELAQAGMGRKTNNDVPLSSIDVFEILNYRQVPWKLIEVPKVPDYSDVIECIDKGFPVIVCVDFRSIPFNQFENQHVNRFWSLTEPGVPQGYGHYVVIKGYIKVDGQLYYETYDPYSRNERYFGNGEEKGFNRYYDAEKVRQGQLSGYGFPYLTVVGRKNNGVPMPPLTRELSADRVKFISNVNNALWVYGF